MKHIWLIPCGPGSNPEATIESIMFQCPNEQIMLVNDGTDLDRFKAADNIQIVSTEKPGTGCAHALNTGIKALSDKDYDWIYRMDADDVVYRGHDRDKQAEQADETELVVAGSMVTPTCRKMIVKGLVPDDIRLALDRRINPIYHPATIIRLSALLKVKTWSGQCWPEQYGMAEDYALWLKICKIGKIKPWQSYWTWYVPNDQYNKEKKDMLKKAAEDAGL